MIVDGKMSFTPRQLKLDESESGGWAVSRLILLL
jgi:hypothetical protein